MDAWASFCEIVWAEDGQNKDEAAYDLVHKARAVLGSATAKDRPIVDRRYPHADMMFDARAYPKGAWVLHMLRSELGDETFFGALHAYYLACRGRSVVTTDFVAAVEQHSKQKLGWFFDQWLDRIGCPELKVARDAGPRDRKSTRLNSSHMVQSRMPSSA